MYIIVIINNCVGQANHIIIDVVKHSTRGVIAVSTTQISIFLCEGFSGRVTHNMRDFVGVLSFMMCEIAVLI